MWHDFDYKDQKTLPAEEGLYAFMIRGDSEYIDGHCIYSFDDYQTFGRFEGVDLDGGVKINFSHDEEISSAYAWFGPILIPPYGE